MPHVPHCFWKCYKTLTFCLVRSPSPATQNDTWTSRNAPYLYLSVFHAFGLGMCFAPQRRALFRHPNFQKLSETVSFQHFWLRNVLCATTVSIFSTFQLPKWSRNGVLCTFWLQNVLRTTACNFSSLIWPDGSAPAALASLLFDPVPQISRKTQRVATILPFRAPSSSFFSGLLSSSLLFSSLTLHTSASPCVRIVRSLTSKLPSISVWTYPCMIISVWLCMIARGCGCLCMHACMTVTWYIFSSSTTQRGGGSFKDRTL